MSGRSVVTVMQKLLDIIPASESELVNEIKTYKSGLWNIAPELLSSRDYWIPLENIMNKHILEIDAEWKTMLVKIFNNETINV
jgi:hypothetical protein